MHDEAPTAAPKNATAGRWHAGVRIEHARPATVLTSLLLNYEIHTLGDLAALDISLIEGTRGVGTVRLAELRRLQDRVRGLLGLSDAPVQPPSAFQPQEDALLRSLGIHSVQQAAQVDLDVLASQRPVNRRMLKALALLKVRAQEQVAQAPVPLLPGVPEETGRRLRALGVVTWEGANTWLDSATGPARHIISPFERQLLERSGQVYRQVLPELLPDETSWEILSPQLSHAVCRRLRTWGCKTVSDVWRLAERTDAASRFAGKEEVVEALRTFKQARPLPTTLAGLATHLLVTLPEDLREMVIGRYARAMSYSELSDEMTRQAVSQRLDAVAVRWLDRFPFLLPRLTAPLVEAFDEAGMLVAESAQALELALAQALILLRAVGRRPALVSLRATASGPRWFNHLSRLYDTPAFEANHPLNAITEISTEDLDARLAAFKSTLLALRRRQVDRAHMLALWDESMGLMLPEATVWRIIEGVMQRTVGPEGLVLEEAEVGE